MFNETKYILLYGSADNAIVNFTTVARSVHLLPVAYTRSKTLTPPANIYCIVSDALVHTVPNVQQTVLQFVNAVQLRLMHLLLDVTGHPISCNRPD